MQTDNSEHLMANGLSGAGFGLGGASMHYLQVGGEIGAAISGILGALISLVFLYRLLNKKGKK